MALLCLWSNRGLCCDDCPWISYMRNEWTKPREYSFTNAAGEVFHEIAYSRMDVNIFAKMHKATNYKPTEDSSICKSRVAD